MVVDDMKKLLDKLDYAKRAVQVCLDDMQALVDMHGVLYWASRVEDLRTQIKEQL